MICAAIGYIRRNTLFLRTVPSRNVVQEEMAGLQERLTDKASHVKSLAEQVKQLQANFAEAESTTAQACLHNMICSQSAELEDMLHSTPV